MRFYSDFQDSAGVILDAQGEDFSDSTAARDTAMRYLAEEYQTTVFEPNR